MTLNDKFEQLKSELIEKLCFIKDTSELLPHTVFIEEEGEDKNGYGVPEFFRYKLLEIFPGGRCALLDSNGIRTHQYELGSINIEWLLAVWNRHLELQAVSEINTK